MHSKGFWRGTQRQRLNVLNVVGEFGEVGRIVESTFTELVVGLEHIGRDVLLENGLDQPYVLVVSHSPAVVDFRPQVVQHFVWDYCVLVQQHFQLLFAHAQILVCEFVSDVPSDWPEFSTVLNDRMEETKSEQKLLVFDWL